MMNTEECGSPERGFIVALDRIVCLFLAISKHRKYIGRKGGINARMILIMCRRFAESKGYEYMIKKLIICSKD